MKYSLQQPVYLCGNQFHDCPTICARASHTTGNLYDHERNYRGWSVPLIHIAVYGTDIQCRTRYVGLSKESLLATWYSTVQYCNSDNIYIFPRGHLNTVPGFPPTRQHYLDWTPGLQLPQSITSKDSKNSSYRQALSALDSPNPVLPVKPFTASMRRVSFYHVPLRVVQLRHSSPLRPLELVLYQYRYRISLFIAHRSPTF